MDGERERDERGNLNRYIFIGVTSVSPLHTWE